MKRCTLCKHNKFLLISKTVRDSKNHSVIKCKNCKHLQLFPIPSLKDEEIFYDNNLQDKNINFFGGIKENRIKSLNDTLRRVQFIQKIASKDDKILEIGSGHGFFIESLEKLNYKITGIEISKEKRNLSKRIVKSPILNINLITENLNLENFDLIVLFHVLEHISDPTDFLMKIKKMLRKNGKIIIEVPNSDDIQLQTNEDYKKFYWQRAHIHYFNPKTLRKAVSKSGLKVKILGIQRYSIENMFNWKITKKPQMNSPSYVLEKPYDWIDNNYKKILEQSLKCDTIFAICK